jgi:alpha-L-fucosidase
MRIKKYVSVGLLLGGLQWSASAAELQWQLPYEAAAARAKETRKPLLVFVGNLEECKDCKEFLQEVCSKPEFIAFAKENLVCTQVLEQRADSREEAIKKFHILEPFNIVHAHAVIIANAEGKRIGELSTRPKSIADFIKDIRTIVAKAPPEGRAKYSEVEMFDKKFVPEKTYEPQPPAFSPEPLKGRYLTFMAGVRANIWETTRPRFHGTWMERDRHSPENALKMRKSLAESFPGARMTWAWSWHALNDQEPNYVELRKLMLQFHKEYGDEITLWQGMYFGDKFNTLEQSKKDLHEGLELVSKMIGDGYRPKSVIAGIMSVEVMKFLAESEGIHVVQGQIWSQFNVDGQGGDGGIIYPYYPSRDHYLKPAQGSRGSADFLDMVNVDGWSVDFFAARNNGGGSRDGVGPLETNGGYGLGPDYGLKQMMHVTDVHFSDEAVKRNGFGFIPNIWEMSIFSWITPKYLPNWLSAIRAKYPDTQLLTLGEFGELWRKHNPDNSRINLTFVERGNGMVTSTEEGKKINPKYEHRRTDLFCPEMEIRWYFNKDFRFATIQNWKENGPKLVLDYTRYNQPYHEPSGNVVEPHWDLMDLINQKRTRTQDRDRSFSSLPPEEQQKILKWYPDSIKAEAPSATSSQPAEPEQLRGLPRPADLPLVQGPFQPTKASLDEHYQWPEWFADAKFGLWAHWGPQSVLMHGWGAKGIYEEGTKPYQDHLAKFGHPSKLGYKDHLPLFTADKFDPQGLMAEFKEMGARMFLAMGVHHDNYDMWDSKYHRWNSVKIGPKKDIVKLWQDAAKKQGLRFGVSEHLAPSFDWWNPNKMSDKKGPLAGVPYDGMNPANWDLYHPPHPGDQEMQGGFGGEINKYPEWFKEHWYRRMYDLVTTYQPDFVDSDDFGLPFGDAYASKLVAHYYNRSAANHGGKPDAVWCGRGGNGKKGVISYNEFGLPKLTWRYPWVYGTSTTGWFWINNQPPTAQTLVKSMVEVICRNGNFILSFPQRADGTVPEDHMDVLREMGKWVRLNEEGIFETRPWRMLGEGPTTTPFNRWDPKEPFFKKEDIRFTRKGGNIYAFLMNPAEDKVLIRSLGKKARLVDGVPQNVRLLGYEEKLNWSQEEDGLKVQLPEAWVGRVVPVLEIRGFAAWDGDIRPGMDGQLVLDVNDSQLHGKTLQQVFGRYFIENWRDPAEWISWDKVHFLEAGEYEVTLYGGGERAEAPYRLTIGEKELTGTAPAAGGWSKGVIFSAGKITIEKAGVYPVALRAGSKENWGGLQIFNATLKRTK